MHDSTGSRAWQGEWENKINRWQVYLFSQMQRFSCLRWDLYICVSFLNLNLTLFGNEVNILKADVRTLLNFKCMPKHQ